MLLFFVPLAFVILVLVAVKVILVGVQQGREELKKEEQEQAKKSPDVIERTTKKAKYCSNCGAALREGAKFCTECGNKVGSITE